MQRTNHLLRSGLLVMLILGLNKLTGFVKLLLMTRSFGAGTEADAFTAANQLPELFDSMLAGGALAAALIPVYTAYLTRQERRQTVALANSVVTLTVLVMGSIGALAAWFALPITQYLLVPEFSPAQQLLTAQLMRIILLSMTLFSIGSIFTSLLHAHQHFFAPALATVLVDLGQILGLYFLAPHWGITGVAWGSVIGAALAWGVQLPAFFRRHIISRPELAWRLTGLRDLFRLMGPRIVTLGIVQAVDLIFLRLASPLPTGSIAAYYYAMLIMVAMPKSLFGLAITTVIFPTLSRQHHTGDEAGLQQMVRKANQAALALVVPGAVGLLALGPAAVAFLLQRGAFNADDTTLVYGLLVIFALRLIAETAHDVLVLPFFARHNTQIPMWVSIGAMGINVGLSYALVNRWQIYGLAAAATSAAVAATLALYRLNQTAVAQGANRALVAGLGRIALAAGGMSAVIFVLRQINLPTLAYLTLAISTGGISYFAVYAAVGGRELQIVLTLLLPTRWQRAGRAEKTGRKCEVKQIQPEP